MNKFLKVEVLLIISKTELKVFSNDHYERFKLNEYGFNPKMPINRWKNHIVHVSLIKDVRRFIRESNNVIAAYFYGVDILIHSLLPETKYSYKMQLGFGEKISMGLPLVMLHRKHKRYTVSLGVSNLGLRSRTKEEEIIPYY